MRIQSAAKINLVLNVLGRRADGYHELQMVMQTVSLYDYLDFARSDTLEVIAPAPLAADVRQNLVYRAAEIFLAKYVPGQGVRITLTKNIPLSAGLAGGSTDCAGTLVGLNHFFQAGLTAQELEQIANTLGSDIAYCLYGGTYLAEGRGEVLSKIPELPQMCGLILKPPCSLSTAEVYKNFAGQQNIFSVQNYLSGQINIGNIKENLGNGLSPAAFQLRPELTDYLTTLNATQPAAVQMSGSGPAFFAFYNDAGARNTAFSALKSAYEVYSVETTSCAQNILEN